MKTSITKITLQGFKSFNKKISIPFLPGFNVVAGPNGSGKCLRGDSLVQLPNGQRKAIKDIVNEAFEKSNSIEELDDGFVTKSNPSNVEILSLNPETLLIETKKVSAFVKRKCPENLIKIKTRSGKEVVSTEYHPVFTFRDGKLIALKAGELKAGLKIATPRSLDVNSEIGKIDFANVFSKDEKLYVPYSGKLENFIRSLIREFGGIKKLSQLCDVPHTVIKSVLDKQSINVYYLSKILRRTGKKFHFDRLKSKTASKSFTAPLKLTDESARFLGYTIADGSSLESTGQVRFVNQEKALLNDFSYIANSQFGLASSIKSYKPVAYDNIIYSKPLQVFLEKVFGINRGHKSSVVEVPGQIFTASDSIKSHFLAGLIDCDGYVNAVIRGNKHQCYLEYSTASKKFAEQVSTLLLSLGIIGLVKEKRKHATNSRQKRVKTYYSVMVYGLRNLKKMMEAIPLRSKKAEKLLEISKWEIKGGNNLDVIPGHNILIKKLVKGLGIKIKKVKSLAPKLAAYYEDRCNATRAGLLEIVEFVTENYPITYEAEQIIKKILLLANSEIFWDEVVSISRIKPYEEWVYDLCVNGTHNFIANNFIVHNSNILDAIAFVLGRTSAKSLRADRLHELIFNGGEGKTAAEYASVTLYLDNSQKQFPFEDGEIAIVRKVSKNGLSIYKLNGKTLTREKILQLLSAVRIHPDGHNIILQGDVTQIIEMNPVERRYYIDEISGIAEYNDKKEKAQKDLDAVDQKLKEAEIIITQRYDIFKKLEDERNAAIKFQNLQKQLTVLKASFAHKKLVTYEEQIKKIDESLVKKEELNRKLNEETGQIEAELDKREASIREVASKLIGISKSVRMDKEVSELRSKLLITKDKMDSDAREVDRINNLVEKLEALESRKVELSGEMPRAVQAILRMNLRGVLGTVANLISVPENYRVAVEVSAGPHLNDIVVEDENVASYCIDFLKRERIGRATFLPLNKIKPYLFRENELLSKYGVINVASKLIKYDTKLMSAIEFVFGNTLVVENLETAKNLGIGKARMVTLDGDLVERSGAMIGGHYIKTHPKLVETITSKEIEMYTSRRRELEEDIKSLRQEVFALEKKLKEYAVSETAKELIDLEKLRIASEREVDELRERRKKAHERKVNLEIEINTANIEKAKLETELENAKNEMQQYGQVEYVDEKLHTLENFIKKTQRELDEIGLVNLKAIDEYEKFKNEFDQYKEKYEKILLEKKAVIEMIEQIEQRRMGVFNKCLQEISNNLNDIYLKMAGGNAKLELENPADIESGLIIEANPAGKRLLNLDSMSGGEKTLAALAFLFAIQKYKPAPFYMFDEVDAALDKENSLKLAELVKSLSKSEQFIVITHNDQTIKSGDTVYGCTMDRGETKIVGLEMPAK